MPGMFVTVNSSNNEYPFDSVSASSGQLYVPYLRKTVSVWMSPGEQQRMNNVKAKTVYPNYCKEREVL